MLAVDRGERDRSGACIILRRGELERLIVHIQVIIVGLGGAHRIGAVHVGGLAGADTYVIGDVDGDRLTCVHLQCRCLRTQRRRKDAVCRYLDECGGGDVVCGVRHRVGHRTRLIGQIHRDYGGRSAALRPRMVGGGIVHADLQLVGGAGRVCDPLRHIHVDRLLIDRCGGRHSVIVGRWRCDGRVLIDVHRQRGSVGKACLVLHRVDDVIRSHLLGSGEREHVVVHLHAVDALRFHIAFDGEVRVVAGDVVLRNRHGGRGVRS